MEFIETKTILTKVKYGSEWYGIDYNMNLYRGCPHRCIYCDSRSNCYHIDNFDIVRGKENALSILEQELSKKREKGVGPYHCINIQIQPVHQGRQNSDM